jgi:hypothetical protein
MSDLRSSSNILLYYLFCFMKTSHKRASCLMDVPLIGVPLIDVPLMDVPLIGVSLMDVPLIGVPLMTCLS